MFWQAPPPGDHPGIKHRAHPHPAQPHANPPEKEVSLAPSSSASALAPSDLAAAHLDLDLECNTRLDLATSLSCQKSISPESLALELPLVQSAWSEACSRGRWLLGLLVLQSTSSFVLEQYKELLLEHIVVTLFLTMLVGAGGNAGNQSAIKVIRALATGSIRVSWQSFRNMMTQQAAVAVLLGGGLSLGGFVRVYATNGDSVNACAISLSLFLIVMTSVVLGTGLPFLLAKAGVDPANAGTSIQVVMDILGVAITCITCQAILVRFAQGLNGK